VSSACHAHLHYCLVGQFQIHTPCTEDVNCGARFRGEVGPKRTWLLQFQKIWWPGWAPKGWSSICHMAAWRTEDRAGPQGGRGRILFGGHCWAPGSSRCRCSRSRPAKPDARGGPAASVRHSTRAPADSLSTSRALSQFARRGGETPSIGRPAILRSRERRAGLAPPSFLVLLCCGLARSVHFAG
jgi:hypothetical protein